MSAFVTVKAHAVALGKTIPWPVPEKVTSRKKSLRGRSIIVVGAGNVGRELAATLRQSTSSGGEVCGLIDEQLPLGGEVLGRVSDLPRLIHTHFVDEMVLAPPHDPAVVRRVMYEAERNRIKVTLVPDLFGQAPQTVSVGRLGSLPVLQLHEKQLPELGLLFKRAFDLFSSVITLPLSLGLMAFAAVLIKLDSPGPVFYRDLRVGKKGRMFHCYKFRSMIPGADRLQDDLRASNERQGPFFKIANDPRITRVGHFLRRYSLDEIPQVLNVLKGDMSWVGPRPHPQKDYARYQLENRRRLAVTPGITGLWQVQARNDPSFERNMELDLEYIEHWSLWLDLKILLATVPVIFRGTGT